MGESLVFFAAMTLFAIRSCKEKEFEVVHAHGTISGLSAVLARLFSGVPFFVSFHQDALIGWETGYNRLGGFRYNLTRFLQARICHFAAVVTVQSQTVQDITRRVLGLNGKIRIAVLPNTVELARFSGDGSYGGGRNVLFVGNLIKRKGVDVLLRSVAILANSFPEVRLTVAGSGPEMTGLQSLARNLGISDNVFFTGEVDDKKLLSLYRGATVVVLPSYSEVFGVVILEAFAANRPIIATATVGATSIITDGVSGRVVPIGDPKGIASAIADVFSHEKAAVDMALAGRQLAVARYSVDAVCGNLGALYRSATPPPTRWNDQ